MNEESEDNDEENINLVESALDVYLQEQQKIMLKKLEETAAKNEGIKTLTDKEIADYLRENGKYVLDKVYRALYKGEGPINSSDITPPPLPLKFMTRALTANIELIIIKWSGGSDEGHLNVELEGKNGKTFYLWANNDPLLQPLFADIEEWCYDAMDYSGAGDGSSYGDIIRYNLKEGTVSTETWWTEEVYGGEGFDTMETC